MRASELIETLEAYYGEAYSPVCRGIVEAYLEGFSARYLDALLVATVKRHSRRFGKSPDVAVFEEVASDVLDALECDRPPAIEQSNTLAPEEKAETERLMAEAAADPVKSKYLGLFASKKGRSR